MKDCLNESNDEFWIFFVRIKKIATITFYFVKRNFTFYFNKKEIIFFYLSK